MLTTYLLRRDVEPSETLARFIDGASESTDPDLAAPQNPVP